MNKVNYIIIIGIAIAVIGAIAFTLVNTTNDESDMMDDTMMDDTMMDDTMMMKTDKIKIGSLLPLTGDLAEHGEDNLAGTMLGVETFNQHLNEIGETWKLVLVSEDTATDPAVALEKLQSLNSKGIGIVIGPETSSNIRNIMGYANSNDMLLLSCCSTAPGLAIENDNVFRFTTNDQNQANVISKLAEDNGIKVLVPIYRGDVWGDGLVKATADKFKEFDGMVDEGIRYNPENPAFEESASILAEKITPLIEQHGDDKVAVVLISFSEGVDFIQFAAKHDVLSKVKWYGSDSSAQSSVIIKDPISREFTNTVGLTSVTITVSDNTINQMVNEKLTETLGRDPIAYAYGSYDAVWVAGLAILDAKSSEVKDIKPRIIPIAEMHMGALGNIILNNAGDLATSDYAIWAIQDGQWIKLGLYQSDSDTIVFNEN